MSAHILERRQTVAAGIESVFAFFEDPSNLEIITPSWLNFEIVSSHDVVVRSQLEAIFDYRREMVARILGVQ